MKKGDFIEIEFTGRIAATGEIFDLTSADVAKKEGIFNPEHTYGPTLVIVGAGMVIPGVERELEKMSVSQENRFNVGPELAFGKRDPKLIKIISLAKFLEKKINPIPGLFVQIDNKSAKVQSVSGGRVRVDFNHPLAGKELSYDLKVVRKITKVSEKAKSLLKHYNLKADTKLSEKKLTIKPEKDLKPEIKKFIEDMVKKWIPEIKSVKFM